MGVPEMHVLHIWHLINLICNFESRDIVHATAVFINSLSVSSTGGDAPAEKQKREGDDIFAEPKAVGIWTV